MGKAFLVSGTQEIFKKLISIAASEDCLALGVEGEMDKLKRTLTTILVFVHDAEKKQVENEAVRRRLWMVKTVAYDADDVLDEFAYEALRHKVEIQNPNMSQVRNHVSSSDLNEFHLKMAPKNIREINKKLHEIKKDALGLGLTVGYVDTTSGYKQNRETDSFIHDSEVFGRVDENQR